MLDALRFVQGAVGKKDYMPALKHFRIEGGRVTSYNGVIALSAPIELGLTVTPRADQFARAIATCDAEISITQTPAGRLGVRSGSFRAFVDCTDEPFPVVEPTGIEVPLAGNPLLYALEAVWPFISDDASRQWSQGVLFSGGSLFATNNVVLVERWLGAPFPFEVNVPKDAVAEMLRIGEEPLRAQVHGGALTLHYREDRWLKTQLYTSEWPAARLILDRAHEKDTMTVIPENFFTQLEKLAPFLGELNQVFYNADGLHTHMAEGIGASVEVANEGEGIFNYKMLKLLQNVAHRFDLSHANGSHCPFVGTMLRGVIMGQR